MSQFVKIGPSGYFKYQLDAGGYRQDVNGVDMLHLLREQVSDKAKAFTDVIIISHGWNSDESEDGTLSIPNKLVKVMSESTPATVNPLYIAIQWPSMVVSLTENPEEDRKARFEQLLKSLRKAIHENEQSTIPEASSPATDMQDMPGTKAVLALEKEAGETNEITEPVKESLAALGTAIALQDTHQEDGCIIDDGRTYGDNLPMLIERRAAHQTTDTSAITGATSGLLGLLGDIIFGQFARRASNVGSRGVHALLAELMIHAPKDARFHLVGHSLGAHVVCSAAIGRAPGSLLTRKVHSLIMLQGAVEGDCFARGRAYRPLATRLRPVAGPIVGTIAAQDEALKWFDLLYDAAVGHAGIKRSAPLRTEERHLDVAEERATQEFEFHRGRCYNIQASGVIASHGDVEKSEVANLIWNAAQVEVPEEGYKVTELSSLPKKYWEQFKVRAENDFGIKSDLGCCTIM